MNLTYKYCNGWSKFFLAGCAVVLASIPGHTQESKLNPVPNSSFETGNEDITGWTVTHNDGSDGSWQWDTHWKSAGLRALKVKKTKSAGYTALVSDYIPLQAGKNYVLESNVRIENRSTANVGFMVSQYAPDSDGMNFPNAFSVFRPLHLTPEFGKLRTLFTIREGNTRIRIHALMYLAPVEVTWDNFTIREAREEDFYRPSREMVPAEDLPPLAPAVERMKQRKEAVAERRVVDGRTRLVVDGQLKEPLIYVSPFPYYANSQIADFKKAGIRLYTLPIPLGDDYYGAGMWKGKGQFDFSILEERLWRILRVDPDAHIILYLVTDPYRKWAVEHPNAIVRDQHGQATVVDMHVMDWGREPRERVEKAYQERYAHSFVSQDLRDDTSDALRRLVAYLKTSSAAKSIVGFHLPGGSDLQYMHWQGYALGQAPNASTMHIDDYSEDSKQGFRNWLRRRYGTEASLQTAWQRPEITFETVQIPTGERRLAPGFFFDPQKERDIIDYNRFYSEGTVETLTLYAKVLKEATGRQKLVSTYWEDAAGGLSDHLATGKILESNDIDFLTGPTSYGVRMPGESGGVRSVWGSLALHNRLWVSEQDWRSIHTQSVDEASDHAFGRAANAEDHNSMVRRESGMMLAFGQGSWWFDMDGGWFGDAGIMRGIAEARQAFTRDLSNSGTLKADVAVFVDERSFDFLKWRTLSFRASVEKQIYALATSGVPYHLYLQSDLPKLKQNYKLCIFVNAHHFDDDEWQALQKLKSNGRVLAFVHAPGVMAQSTLKASDADDAIYKTTGIHVQGSGAQGIGTQSDAEDQDLTVESLPAEQRKSPLAIANSIASAIYQPTNTLLRGPVWAVDDTQAQALGLYKDGRVGAAVKPMQGWTSVFVGGTILTDSFLNALARYSGSWVAGDAGDAIYANQHILTAHAISDGTKKFTLAQPSQINDLSTGKIVAQKAGTFSIPMKRGETRWFALQPSK